MIDHEQRRRLILERSFALFAEEGFDGVTYQKIADRCGIARTVIYKYFKNKELIFDYAVSLATGNLTAMTDKILTRKDLSALEKIGRVMHVTVKMLENNRVFLTVILDYVLMQKQKGKDLKRKIRRHTIGMKYLLTKLLRESEKNGESAVRYPETAASHLYGILESCVLNLTVTEILDAKDCLILIDRYLENLG
ncbi:MAG: TetR/AcrR family transcriptional regulator [Planctomycetaceae bacterium]|jgi:AcrR family transcriptional regulator|nr:TetR/AcrR family transcriptional regulator [Planctomycetaceae bacterium]